MEELLKESITIFGMYESALRAVLDMARTMQVNSTFSEDTLKELQIKELQAKDIVAEAQLAENNLYKKYGVTRKAIQNDTTTDKQ